MNLYEGVTTFDTLHRRAFWKKFLGKLRHHQHRLLPLAPWREIADTSEEVYRGIQTVPIEKIVGTEDRFADFDREFLPLNKQNRQRWARIHLLYQSGAPLPPVSLIKMGDFYFVRDGHHRISVAKATQAQYIDAEVVEIPLGNIASARSPEELFHQMEEQIFREKTGLRDIQVTVPGGYLELLHFIQCFQCSSCPNNEEKRAEHPDCIPWEEAVRGWYENCYRRAVEVIEKSNIVQRFKNRTPADFYLWALYNLDLLRKAICFVPSSPRLPLREKPASLIVPRSSLPAK